MFTRVAGLGELRKETAIYNEMHPKSALQAEKSKHHLLTGNGMNWARLATGRLKTVVFNHGYHGSVDEVLAELDESGQVVPKEGDLGFGINPAETTKVVEFNDIEAARKALMDGDVAISLIEPVPTNMCQIAPKSDSLFASSLDRMLSF